MFGSSGYRPKCIYFAYSICFSIAGYTKSNYQQPESYQHTLKFFHQHWPFCFGDSDRIISITSDNYLHLFIYQYDNLNATVM